MESAHVELHAEGASSLLAQVLDSELSYLVSKLAAWPKGARNLAVNFHCRLPSYGKKILFGTAFAALQVNSCVDPTRTARVSSIRSSPNSSHGSLYKPIPLPRPSA